jgi:hypothetical protein
MNPVALFSLFFFIAILVFGWAYLIVRQRSLPRLSALLVRKPHATRRAHVIRQLVFNLEMLRIWVPGATAMLLAILLGLYLVNVLGWPDVIGVALFLPVLVLVWVVYCVRSERLTRRMGLSCPECGVPLIEECGLQFVKTGQCPECSNALFRM